VRTSSAEIGQGLVAVLQLIAAEELHLPHERVHVLLSDTDLTPDGGPTTASRQTYVTGNAVRLAAEGLRQAMAATLAERYDLPPDQVRFHEGLAQVDGRQLTLGDVARMMKAEGRPPRAGYASIGHRRRNRWGPTVGCTSSSRSPPRLPRWRSMSRPAK
jgi:xanthine dehydrogenase molybdenum-binding subunit